MFAGFLRGGGVVVGWGGMGADTRGIKFRFEMAAFLHLKGSRWVLFFKKFQSA